MIRFIIETVSSRRDINGNRYHYATITSTATEKRLKVRDIGGPSNARGMVMNANPAYCGELYSVEREIPIREFDRARRFHETGAFMEHEVTATMICDLERGESA